MNNEIRLRNDMRVFKSVNHKQKQQYLADRFKYVDDCIDDYVNTYNDNRLDGEAEITRDEMIEQLSRKV